MLETGGPVVQEDVEHLIRKVPYRDDRGQIIGVIGIAVDISDRLRAEVALRESELRFRAIFESAAVGAAVTDTDGRMVETNAAYERMVGYDKDELRGMHWEQVTHPDDIGVDRELETQFLAHEIERYWLEKRYLRQDGGIAWGRMHVARVTGTEQVIVLVEDVTEPRAGGAASSCATARGDRWPGRRRRSRLQQPPDGDHRLQRVAARCDAGGDARAGRCRGDPPRRRPGRVADAAAPCVQPRPGARARARRRQRDRARDRQAAAALDR